MQPIISYFQGLFKFMKRHLLAIFSIQLNVFSLCYRHASFFPFFIFMNFHQQTRSIFMWNMKKAYPFKQDMLRHIYIRQILYKTHVYVFLFSVKKRVFELSRG